MTAQLSCDVNEELEERKRAWTTLQLDLASRAVFVDSDLTFQVNASESHHTPASNCDDYRQPRVWHASCGFAGLTCVGGLDISFVPGSAEAGNDAIATLAVLDFPELNVIHVISRRITLAAPYIPSFLSMREAQPLVDLVAELRQTPSVPFPQVFLVDGNGRLHERQAGLAVAVGVMADVPAIGCAKEYQPLCAGEARKAEAPWRYSQKAFKQKCKQILRRRGDWLGIHDKAASEYWGAAVVTSPAEDATSPLFVSPGHRVSLETAIAVSLACCSAARVPEPTRQADALSREQVRQLARFGTGALQSS